MEDEKVIETLRSMGLTEYEARIYYALVKYGPQSAKEISTKSGVPKNRIYESVDRLERNGFIEEIPDVPKKYQVTNPSLVLDERTKLLEELNEYLGNLYKKSKEKTESPIRIAFGRKSAVNARLFDFRLTKKSLCAIVGLRHITTKRLGMIDREAKKAIENGVKIKFLLNMNYPENKEKAKFMRKFGVKYKHFPAEDFILAILDKEIVRIEIPDPEKERINIWIKNRDLAEKFQMFFDEEWKKLN